MKKNSHSFFLMRKPRLQRWRGGCVCMGEGAEDALEATCFASLTRQPQGMHMTLVVTLVVCLVGVTLAQEPCATALSCTTCQAEAGCGWCAATRLCLNGTVAGPVAGGPKCLVSVAFFSLFGCSKQRTRSPGSTPTAEAAAPTARLARARRRASSVRRRPSAWRVRTDAAWTVRHLTRRACASCRASARAACMSHARRARAMRPAPATGAKPSVFACPTTRLHPRRARVWTRIPRRARSVPPLASASDAHRRPGVGGAGPSARVRRGRVWWGPASLTLP